MRQSRFDEVKNTIRELNLNELQAVAGGGLPTTAPRPSDSGGCGCGPGPYTPPS